MHQSLSPTRTTWHITWGTYGTRLHGGPRPTVNKKHNQLGEEFLGVDVDRESRARRSMKGTSIYLSIPQRQFIEAELPSICIRGGWDYRVCAAGPDHVHLLCDILPEIHGEKARRLAKKWLGQELSKTWPLIDHPRWWAVEGSNKAVKDEEYLNNAFVYIRDQRTVAIAGGEFEGAASSPTADRSPRSGTTRLAEKGLLHFHVNVLARSGAFPVTFDEAQSRLMQLPRMDAEPDGYFLLAGGEKEGHRWVVNGQLFEHADRLHRVELRGSCPEETFDYLLRCFGWPEVEIAFEMTREGVTYDETSFRERTQRST